MEVKTKNDEKIVVRDGGIPHSEFDDINMQGSRFHDLDLTEAQFDDVDMSRTEFSDSCLCDTRFTSINLTGAEFHDCDFQGTRINGILLTELLERYEKESGPRGQGGFQDNS